MESVFGWVQQIFDAVLSCFPRRVLVPPTCKLLKYTCLGKIIEKDQGLRWYFPLLTKIEEIAVARQSLNDILPVKFLSKNFIPCIADASCIYYVSDVTKYATENYDAQDAIRESLYASLCSYLNNKPIESLQDLDMINEELTDVVIEDLDGFGVEIECVRINNLTWVIPVASI